MTQTAGRKTTECIQMPESKAVLTETHPAECVKSEHDSASDDEYD